MLRSNLLPSLLGALVLATLSCDRDWSGRVTSEGMVTRSDEPALKYRVLGSGPDTAVVLHGGPGLSMRYLLPPFSRLDSRYTLIFYDLRGRGESGDPRDSSAVSLDGDLDDLAAVRGHFRLGRLKLIGHHWGGAVAALFAVRHPDQVDRVVLVSPYPVHRTFFAQFTFVVGDSALWREAVHHVATARTADEAKRFCLDWWPTYFSPLPPHPSTPYAELAPSVCDESGERLLQVERTGRWISRSVGPTPWREQLNATPTPTLVIEGAGDTTVTRAATRWAQHLPEGRVLTVAAPYLFPWVGAPRAFRRAVAEFLGGRWPDSAVKPPPFVVTTPASATGTTTGPRGTEPSAP